ncbi:hypothetical protein TRFO_24553 [Tritrichomonas foetus]|uniref:Uncharacterized protein n=1 Tax=Tritrichomonas foetus TaxID=1144522 RepID=A0A1J4JPI4_9EUKA|nr:hypothetical protein TRFO_34107 [Tritrichomonas foetus]OHT07299.1 hypothetical protein TRFO_24553 [Tritrichomonas foetus]|eukprot:OHS99427.1 hypothetical protein TRFO_34107 [Tritrichomonas foetus]
MIKYFPKISEEAVERIHAHPDKNVSIYCFKQIKLYDFLLLPIIDEEDNQKANDNYVYCIKCSKWLKTSSTLGNVKAHMK